MGQGIKLSAMRVGGIVGLVVVLAVIAAWLGMRLHGGGISNTEAETAYSSPADLDSRIRDYLLRHPETVVEALQAMEKRQREAQVDDLKQIIATRHDEIFGDPETPVGGNPDGKVSLVEFFDYNCPYCRRVAKVMIELESSEPDLRVVYKDFPILGPNSSFAAKAALASRQQGKYLALHDAMINADGLMSEKTVIDKAAAVGIDTERLRKDMEDPGVQKIIDRNHELAAALRITGTPGFVIGDEMRMGAMDLEAFKSLIDQGRRK